MLDSSYDKGICFGVVEKLSGMGYKFHKRLLLLEEGVLSYYSKVPKDAEEGFLTLIAFKAMGIKPKLSIQAKYITNIKPGQKALADKKKKSHVFVIEFTKSAFTGSKKKSNENGKSEPELQWSFSVNNNEEYEKWTEILNQSKSSETVTDAENKAMSPVMPKISSRRQNVLPMSNSTENSMIDTSPVTVKKLIKARQEMTEQPILENGKPMEEQGVEEVELSPGKLKKIKSVRWKESATFQMDQNEIKYEDRLREIEEGLRLQRRMEEERKRQEDQMREIKRKEQEALMNKQRMEDESRRKEQQEKLKYAWEHNFNMKISESIKPSHSIEDKIKSGFEIAKCIGEFRTEAVDLCKSIIDELSLPVSEKVYAAYEKTVHNKQHNKTSQRIFFFSGLIVRITWADREEIETGEQVFSELYTDKMIKSYSHEFRAINILNDTLYLLNKDRGELAYRVPLSVIVDYKGFRCLVTSNPPIDGDDTLQLGPIMSSGAYRSNGDLESLDFIAAELMLKKHKFLLDDNTTNVDVQFSVFTEIHKVTFSAIDDDKNEMKIPNMPEAKLNFGDRRVYSCYYITKTADIFPVDIDLETAKNPSFLKRLRPEFMLEYEKPLSADAFVNHHVGENSEDEEDDIEVVEAGIHLRTVVIPAFIKKLDSLEIMMVDSASLTQALHCHGINLRYLGLICQQTNLPHVKEVCIVEMIARTVKKILRREISSIVLQELEKEEELSRKEGNDGLSSGIELQGLTSKPVNPKEEDRRVSKAKAAVKLSEIDQNIGDCVVELLNFIFGKGKDSVRFWSEILSEQVLYDYNYDIKNLQKTEIALGGLLHAVIHHCNIRIKVDDEIHEKLDKVPNPFSRSCFEEMKPRSKVFSLHSLDVKSLSDRYTQIRASKQYDAAIKSCLLAQSLEMLMAYKGENNDNPVLLGEMGEIYFEKGDLDKAYELACEALGHSRPSHVEALKSLCIIMKVHTLRGETELALENLEHAVQRLNFHLGLYHPLYSTIYSMLGSYYAQTKNFQDAYLLYKESLGRCKRDLGPNHPITGEVYIDLGNLTLKMHQQEDALNYFDHAFCVFEASKGDDSIECANMSYMMATLLMSFGKIKEAMAAVEHALKIYEKNEGDFVEKIAECCLLVCSIGESRNNDKLTLDHANKIWNILNKMPTKNEMHYKSRILTLTLTALIHGLSADKKNFLYYISDSIVDVLGQENMLDKLYGSGEDTTLQKKYLEIIFAKSQASKNIRNLLRDILKTLFQKLQEKDLKAFFREYRKNLEMLDDLQLKECLNDFEMLIFIHGIQYFHDAFKKF